MFALSLSSKLFSEFVYFVVVSNVTNKMADNRMPRRMSATQALDFLSRVMEDSDEESSFSSEGEYNIFT